MTAPTVTLTIVVEIEGQRFEMTRADAVALQRALDAAIGANDCNTQALWPGIRIGGSPLAQYVNEGTKVAA